MWLSRGRGIERQPLDLTKVAITPFDKSHILNRFECGATPLNNFLRNKAKHCVARNEHKVFVGTLEGSPNCIGYYALQLGSDAIPEAYKHKKQDYIQNYAAFPAVNLSFVAVHEAYQGQGLGRYLLVDVFEKVAAIAEHAGFYALTLQSCDEGSTSFYRKLGFEEYSEGGGQPKMLYPLVNILRLLGRV